MIQLTRLNNHPLVVNSDMIKFIEDAPDTVLTLITDEKVLVLEPPEEVIRLIVAFRRRVLDKLTWSTLALGPSGVSGAGPTEIE